MKLSELRTKFKRPDDEDGSVLFRPEDCVFAIDAIDGAWTEFLIQNEGREKKKDQRIDELTWEVGQLNKKLMRLYERSFKLVAIVARVDDDDDE